MPRRFALFVLLTVVAALCGCMKVGPDFKRPDVQTPPAWLEALQAQSRPEQPVPAQWWKVLGDPALDRLVEKASRDNIPLQVAAVRILEARAQLGVAVGQLYPQTQQGTGGYTYNQTSMNAPTSPQPGERASAQWTYWQNSLGFKAAWELDFWGKYRRGAESAQASLAASVADYDNAMVTLVSDVASAYVNLRVAEERLRITRLNAKLEREGLDIADIRFKLGATSERDVQQAQSLLQSTEATIPQLAASVQKAKHALCLLMGMPPQGLDDLLGKEKSAIPTCPEGIGVGIPADLLRRRPDIRKAEFSAAAQCANIGVAKADLFPSLSLTGNVGWLASTMGAFKLADLLTNQSFTASFAPGVTWNLFNYGRIVDSVRVQDARFQQALLTYRNTVLTALKETEDSLSDYQGARKQAESLALAVRAATRSAELAFLQYREGKTDYTTVIVAQRDQLTQQDTLAQAQGSIVLGMVGLYRSLGGGWELRRQTELLPADVKQEMAKRTHWGRLLGEPTQKQEDPAKAGPGRYLPDF